MTFLKIIICGLVILVTLVDLVAFIIKKVSSKARESQEARVNDVLGVTEKLADIVPMSATAYKGLILTAYAIMLSPYIVLAFIPEVGPVLMTLCVSYVAMSLVSVWVRLTKWIQTGDREPMVNPDTELINNMVSGAILLLTVATLLGL